MKEPALCRGNVREVTVQLLEEDQIGFRCFGPDYCLAVAGLA
jgi:hypothetical protein